MLDKLKVLLNISGTTKDALLNQIIAMATQQALDYTNRTQATDDMNTAILQMCVYIYNRLGTEGVEGENYNGISFNYEIDYPPSILRSLEMKRRVVVL